MCRMKHVIYVYETLVQTHEQLADKMKGIFRDMAVYSIVDINAFGASVISGIRIPALVDQMRNTCTI